MEGNREGGWEGDIRAKRKGRLGGREGVNTVMVGSIVFSNLGGNLSSPESLATGGRRQGAQQSTPPSLHPPQRLYLNSSA